MCTTKKAQTLHRVLPAKEYRQCGPDAAAGKDELGFTIIEILMVTALMGIIAALAVPKYQAISAQSELQKQSWNFYRELTAARSIAMKNDALVWVKFSTSACTLSVDTSGDGVRQPGEKVKTFVISTPVSIGIPLNGPVSAPDNLPFNSGGMAGEWANQMVISNDAVGTINNGAVYMKNSRLRRHTYCIGMSSQFQSMKLFKWDGSSWKTL